MIENSNLSAIIECPVCSYRKVVPLGSARHGTMLKCPRKTCGQEFTYRLRLSFDSQVFPDISPEAFAHSLDKNATNALRNIPGLDLAIRKMMEYGYEKLFRINAMADAVKVTPRTMSHIYDMARQASDCLGVSIPEVFVFQDPRPNAFTIGTEYPMVMLNSELVDLLSEDELYAVIAHETGHIKCHHVLYLTLYNFLKNCLGSLGAFGSLILPLNLALAEWHRKAELSSDRAALIVTNNEKSVIGVLMKISAGSRSIHKHMNENDFLNQAEQFENLTREIGLNRFFRFASYIWRSHPFNVLRASEIKKYAESHEYEKIRNGEYPKRRERQENKQEKTTGRCSQCGGNLISKSPFCDRCGHPVEKLANQYDLDGLDEFLKTMKSGYLKMKEHFVNEKEDETHSWEGSRPEDYPDIEPRMCTVCWEMFYSPNLKVCPHDGGELV